MPELLKDIMVPLEKHMIVSEEATVGAAISAYLNAVRRATSDRHVHNFLLITDESGELVGLIDGSFLRSAERSLESTKTGTQPRRWLEETRVCSIMRRFDGSIDADAKLEDASLKMVHGNNEFLPITRNGRIIGLLYLSDILKATDDSLARHVSNARTSDTIETPQSTAANVVQLMQNKEKSDE